jgi:protease II
LKKKDYKQYCRRKDGSEHDEVLLDLNVDHSEHAYRVIQSFRVSPDHTKLAYSIDIDGSEVHTVYVKDLSTGKLLKKTVKETAVSLEWAADSTHLFFDRFDPITKRPFQIWRTSILDETHEDMLFEELDPAYELQFHSSGDGRYIIIDLFCGVSAAHLALDGKSSLKNGKYNIDNKRQTKTTRTHTHTHTHTHTQLTRQRRSHLLSFRIIITARRRLRRTTCATSITGLATSTRYSSWRRIARIR